ncbi:MAG: anaerobic ribonucleoside-triphosphate reductase activating protein [bacterium]|nr:anaerobic ribonucleoside-triphosphate reductase activating protein [bacterium]
MRYHNITTDDMLNGDGLRVVLWVAGCEHHCKNCHNPYTWDINGGIPFDSAAKEELFNELKKPYISGITFSGGDPLHIRNRAEIANLIYEIKKDFPDKTIWLYTGYEWEDICNLFYIGKVDVIVDGEYKETMRDTNLCWRGSSNQDVIDVKQSLEKDTKILWCK